MTMLKPLAVWNTNNRGKVLQGREYQTTVTDRNGTDLTEAEDIKKRRQEYIEELYKKHLKDPGVITHLEPDILDSEVKWSYEASQQTKLAGGDGIQAELFQILIDDAVTVLHSMCQQIWKTQQWPQD